MTLLLRRTLFPVAIVGVLLALHFSPLGADIDRGSLVAIKQSMMGTIWNIEVVDHGYSQQARSAIQRAYEELARIDALMSEWKPESPISQVDAAAGKRAVEVPQELRELLERSVSYSERTQGTFDVTWRGMGRIWRFDDAFTVPSAAEIDRARRHIDYRAIQIKGNSIYLPTGKNIGLGGIAKGYAVDRVVELLVKAGFSDCLVDGGGDVRVSGTHNGRPWRLGIQNPRAEHGLILGAIKLSNKALVTSGDYERFRIVNGVRYHHIIDPRTGWPATASISVSVLCDNTEQGVVLAKAIFILGPDEGMALARREGVDAMLVDPQGKRHATEGFDRVFESIGQ